MNTYLGATTDGVNWDIINLSEIDHREVGNRFSGKPYASISLWAAITNFLKKGHRDIWLVNAYPEDFKNKRKLAKIFYNGKRMNRSVNDIYDTYINEFRG